MSHPLNQRNRHLPIAGRVAFYFGRKGAKRVVAKQIRLHDHVYYRLDQERRKRETFSDVVKRLLDLADQVRHQQKGG